MPLNEYQRAFLGNELVAKTQVIDPDTGEPVNWDDIVAQALEGSVTDETLLAAVTAAVTEAMQNAATDEELAAALTEALESIPEVGDTFVQNFIENNFYTTQVINQPLGIPGLDSNGKVGKGQTRYTDAAVSFVLGDGISGITTGLKGFVRIPFACTIISVDLIADQSGSIVIDIWKDSYANHPPTVADTITASAKPTLSSAVKSSDSTLTGWTKSVAAGDILAFKVDSAATVTLVTLVINLERS